MAEYNKEQLWELYEQLPEDLQKAVFSEDVGEKVQGICYDNDITDNKKFTEILKNVGYVFLGLLDLKAFQGAIKKMKVKNNEEIYARINNEIFSELKESLEALYGEKIEFKKVINKPTEKAIKRQDKYLEPIE
jgi:hypothetical protein